MKFLIFVFLLAVAPIFGGQEESLIPDAEGAKVFNVSLSTLRERLKEKFGKALRLFEQGGEEADYRNLLAEIQETKKEIRALEKKWQEKAAKESFGDEEYALWDIGETTLAQLIMEYGASDYLYVIPPEISGMKMSLFSSIPLPRESWDEMIEMILAQNGIGVRRLNPFVKQLYILKLDPSTIQGIVSNPQELNFFDNQERLFFVFSPPPEQLKAVQSFFERFSDPRQTTIHSIGSKIVLVATRDAIEKLIGLYNAVWEGGKGKVVKILNTTKVGTQEAERILKTVFSDSASKGRPAYYTGVGEELSILSLPQGLVLIGESEAVNRGERILMDLENQLEDPSEKIIYWYACKHSNPEDIAAVLEKVYDSLVGSTLEKKMELPLVVPSPPPPLSPPAAEPGQLPGPIYPPANPPFNPILPATAPFIQPALLEKDQKTSFGNFIVDLKTTSILMVVRREELSKIKVLLKKLDVPKRMVQLDVLLVEKKLSDRKEVGINLLKFGTSASNKTENSLTFNEEKEGMPKGVLQYMFSRPGGKSPGFDLIYNFLLAQEDLRINANPSVLAINQTPATVSIVEEISIDNGAIPVQLSGGGVTMQRSFTRAQYGITINITPTIHLSDDDEADKTGFVSLQTNLEFDTTQMTPNDRPPVHRRHIENQVCVADGETVILGGLRKKIEEDTREKIPFLGDLPGIGKLFGSTKINDTNTEMFVFITPRIIHHPIDDLRNIRQKEYQMRAGDIPEFLQRLDEAKNQERKNLFENSMKMLFDM